MKKFFSYFAAHFASATGAYTIVCDLAGAKATKKYLKKNSKRAYSSGG